MYTLQVHHSSMNGEEMVLLYGVPKGVTEREQLLFTDRTPELIDKVKTLASRDGFHSFRVAVIDLTVAKTILWRD